MAKFPTKVDCSVTVKVPLVHAHAYLWDVVGSSECIPGLDTCKRVDDHTYRFVYRERSSGPISMVVQYTARYETNGVDEISFEGINAKGDNTDVSGVIRLRPSGTEATKILLRQTLAPDTPVPRLLQGLVKSYAEREAATAVKEYLANLKRQLEAGA